MSAVDCIELEGHILLFYSSDHMPPHFHVRRTGEWEIRVYILTTTLDKLDFSVKWPKSFSGPSGKVQRRLRELVVENRVALLREWEAKVIVS